MPLPLPAVNNDLTRFALVIGGQPAPVQPSGNVKLTRAPGDENGFYYLDKLSELTFNGGEGWRLLWAIENSTDRCQSIGLLVETWDADTGRHKFEHQAVFTTTECTFDPDRCSVSVTPTDASAYRDLLENYDTEYNLLDCPAPRLTTSAQLGVLAAGVTFEFRRIDKDQEGDYIGTDGWALFYRDNSYIYNDTGFGPTSSFRVSRNLVIFRYRQQVRLTPIAGTSPQQYRLINRSAGGWTPLIPAAANAGPTAVTVPVITYVKTPDIDGFQAATLGGSGGGTPFLATGVEYVYTTSGTGGRYDVNPSLKGLVLLSLPCGDTPAQHGFNNADYVRVTGVEGEGANNAESPGASCLNARVETDDENYRALYWRFGSFRFTRCIPLLDGLHWLLRCTGTPPVNDLGVLPDPVPGVAGLLPTVPALLSGFFANSTNAATGQSGPANELPRLQLSAASDVKRFGASEAATRLMVSLKTVLNDLSALYDVGWFIDPVSGKLRIEHRSYLETQQAAGTVVDLPAEPGAVLPRAYAYRNSELPRYEELSIAGAVTQVTATSTYYDKASLDYGAVGCVNRREGQNKSTRASARLTGDVPGMVLSSGNIPDSAIALLAPDTQGQLSDANALVSASSLQARYHRRGMAAGAATLTGGASVLAQSVRPQRVQENQSVSFGTLRPLPATARITTKLGANAQLAKAELDLKTGKVTASVWLSVPEATADAPVVGRQFDDSFNPSFR